MESVSTLSVSPRFDEPPVLWRRPPRSGLGSFKVEGMDLIDRMHKEARSGASLTTMCRIFKQVPVESMVHWMRTNGFIGNGER